MGCGMAGDVELDFGGSETSNFRARNFSKIALAAEILLQISTCGSFFSESGKWPCHTPQRTGGSSCNNLPTQKAQGRINFLSFTCPNIRPGTSKRHFWENVFPEHSWSCLMSQPLSPRQASWRGSPVETEFSLQPSCQRPLAVDWRHPNKSKKTPAYHLSRNYCGTGLIFDF